MDQKQWRKLLHSTKLNETLDTQREDNLEWLRDDFYSLELIGERGYNEMNGFRKKFRGENNPPKNELKKANTAIEKKIKEVKELLKKLESRYKELKTQGLL